MSSYLVLAAGEDFVFNNIPLGVVEEVSDIPYNVDNLEQCARDRKAVFQAHL